MDQGTDPKCTWTDLMSQKLVFDKENVVMKDQTIQWPEFEFNFTGETLKVFMDHNYSQVILKKKVKKDKPNKLPKPGKLPKRGKLSKRGKLHKPGKLPKLAKPPKPELEPESVWIDFEESDDDVQPQPSKDPDYYPSAEDYSTDSAQEGKLSDWYCTTDEECAADALEEQQGEPASEHMMPVPVTDNYSGIASKEDPEHWEEVNQMVPNQEGVQQTECFDSSILKEEPPMIKTEHEETADWQYPQSSAVVEGGKLLVVGKEIVMKTIEEETCGTQENFPVSSVSEGTIAQSLGTEILMKTIKKEEFASLESSPVAWELGALSARSLHTDIKPENEEQFEADTMHGGAEHNADGMSTDVTQGSSVLKPKEEEESTETEDSDEDGGHFSGASIAQDTGYGSVTVKQEASDATDLQEVLPTEGRRKRLCSPSPTEIPTSKSVRYRSGGTNENLRNLSVSRKYEEREEILTKEEDVSSPIKAASVGRSFNKESGAPYRCCNCGITFTYYEPRFILRSFRGTEGQPSCPNCGQKCEKVPQIIHHTCSQCAENFQTKEELIEHQTATSHNASWCAECERGFKTKTGLKWHKYYIHRRRKEVKCNECGKCFKRKQSLIAHCRPQKKDSSVNSTKLLKAQTSCKNFYPCSECSQTFTRAAHLINHERCHTGERPFKCKKCKRRFKRKSHLLRHLLVHGIGKPFQCEVCDNGFTKHCYYVNHMELHKETNPSCSVCGQTFPTRLCLKRHERDEHSDGSVHTCDQCGKEFRLIHYFLKHQKTHLREKKRKMC